MKIERHSGTAENQTWNRCRSEHACAWRGGNRGGPRFQPIQGLDTNFPCSEREDRSLPVVDPTGARVSVAATGSDTRVAQTQSNSTELQKSSDSSSGEEGL